MRRRRVLDSFRKGNKIQLLDSSFPIEFFLTESLKQRAVPELHTDSPCPSAQQFFLQGHMEVDGNGKMSSGRTYN